MAHVVEDHFGYSGTPRIDRRLPSKAGVIPMELMSVTTGRNSPVD